jgi:hypothetical protein
MQSIKLLKFKYADQIEFIKYYNSGQLSEVLVEFIL